MRKNSLFAILIAAVLVVLAGATPAAAQNPVAGSISVTGDAEVKAAPDQVMMVFGVETWDKDIRKAKTANDDRIKRLLAVTREYGIDPKYVQTDRISVDPRYKNGNYTEGDFIGYFVRKTTAITLQDVSKFEDVYTAALGAGVTHVQGIEFRTTELRKYRDQARALAIQAAQEKATALAGELGLKIGKAQSIREDYSGWSSGYGTRWGGGMMQNVVQNSGDASPLGDESTLAPGQISIRARISVTFELQ